MMNGCPYFRASFCVWRQGAAQQGDGLSRNPVTEWQSCAPSVREVAAVCRMGSVPLRDPILWLSFLKSVSFPVGISGLWGSLPHGVEDSVCVWGVTPFTTWEAFAGAIFCIFPPLLFSDTTIRYKQICHMYHYLSGDIFCFFVLCRESPKLPLPLIPYLGKGCFFFYIA